MSALASSMRPTSTDLGQCLYFASFTPFAMTQLAEEAWPSASRAWSELAILVRLSALAHLRTPSFLYAVLYLFLVNYEEFAMN